MKSFKEFILAEDINNWALSQLGKKFKNEEKAVNVMTKIISVITKVVCVGLSLAFLVPFKLSYSSLNFFESTVATLFSLSSLWSR